jgi:hypothetical protein
MKTTYRGTTGKVDIVRLRTSHPAHIRQSAAELSVTGHTKLADARHNAAPATPSKYSASFASVVCGEKAQSAGNAECSSPHATYTTYTTTGHRQHSGLNQRHTGSHVFKRMR